MSRATIDFSTWLGRWPFRPLHYHSLHDLQKKLESLDVAHAHVAPIDGILRDDPMSANLELLEKLAAPAHSDGFFSPVPVLDLSYPHWPEMLAQGLQDARVRLIKLLPTFHMYSFDAATLAPLVRKATPSGLVISIHLRIEDIRSQSHLLSVTDMPLARIVEVLEHFPEQRFLLHNLYWKEIAAVLPRLANAYVDIASIERGSTLKELCRAYPADRFVFASHIPFYYPEANIYKLQCGQVQPGMIERIYKNGRTMLGDS